MKNSLKINYNNYKIGVDEIEGLHEVMQEIMRPIRDLLREKCYWNKQLKFESTEYNSRDGFVAYPSNLGGIQVWEIIPKCEEYDFGFLEFGEYEPSRDDLTEKEQDSEHDSDGSSGYLDASLRVWLKFEGLEGDTLKFYLYVGGGNGDAPYFRINSESDIYEASFEAKSLIGIKRAASKHIKTLLKLME